MFLRLEYLMLEVKAVNSLGKYMLMAKLEMTTTSDECPLMFCR